MSGGCVNAVVFALGISIFFQLVGAGMCSLWGFVHRLLNLVGAVLVVLFLSLFCLVDVLVELLSVLVVLVAPF